MTRIQTNRVIELYKNNNTLQNIAQQLNTTTTTVRNHLMKAGIKTRSIKEAWDIKNAKTRIKIINLINNNDVITDTDIAQQLNTTTLTIRKYRRRLEKQGLIKKVSATERKYNKRRKNMLK